MSKPSEDGYILLGVLILLVIFVIAMSVALPKIAASIQRDREVETMYRGKQYIRAVQLYYRKFNAYPPGIDALLNTNNIKFLRKRYTDPMTGKDDWKPIAFCQNKAPIAMGFFGQPLGAASGCGVMAGTGPTGGNGIGGPLGGNSTNSNNTTSGSLFNNSNGSGGQNGSGTIQGSSTDGSGQNGQAGQNGQTGTSGAQGTPTDANGNPTGGTSGDSGGPTLGAGGMIGVRPVTDKPSILIYKKKTKYSEWEFTYSPLMDQPALAGGSFGGGLGGTGTGGTGGIGGGGTGGIGGIGGGTGGTGGTGTTPVQPPPPGSPQQ
jgi:type II secretory pathway pseudopilin PulG